MFDDDDLAFVPILTASFVLFFGGFYILISRPFATQAVCFWLFCGTAGAPTVLGIDANVFIASVMFILGTVVLALSLRSDD